MRTSDFVFKLLPRPWLPTFPALAKQKQKKLKSVDLGHGMLLPETGNRRIQASLSLAGVRAGACVSESVCLSPRRFETSRLFGFPSFLPHPSPYSSSAWGAGKLFRSLVTVVSSRSSSPLFALPPSLHGPGHPRDIFVSCWQGHRLPKPGASSSSVNCCIDFFAGSCLLPAANEPPHSTALVPQQPHPPARL